MTTIAGQTDDQLHKGKVCEWCFHQNGYLLPPYFLIFLWVFYAVLLQVFNQTLPWTSIPSRKEMQKHSLLLAVLHKPKQAPTSLPNKGFMKTLPYHQTTFNNMPTFVCWVCFNELAYFHLLAWWSQPLWSLLLTYLHNEGINNKLSEIIIQVLGKI